MSIHIPVFLRNYEINKYLDKLIFFGIKCYSDMKDDEKEKLAHLIINSMGNDILDILDLEDDDFLLTNDNKKTIFAKIENKFSYYIEEILSEMLEEKESSHRYEMGLRSFTDRQNGELTWRRTF